MSNIAPLERDLLQQIETAPDQRALEEVRIATLGKRGCIAELLKTLGGMPADQRKIQGPLLNGLRDRVANSIAARKRQIEDATLEARLMTERIDVTLPAPEIACGSIHPVSHVRDELVAIFADLDFKVAEGPDVESDEYNFSKLNIPPEHPARQMHDTFYLKPQADGSRPLLRTHTSPVQVRTMLAQKPPIRIIAPGRTYRRDSDATHSPMFHQVEGLVVDSQTHLGHLKWILEEFCKAYFEVPAIGMRLRPSYFPFTEPSVEVDMQCDRSGGQIRFGEGKDWMEMGGAGMVHSRVLELCGIDPHRYQGFAFGFGIDRLAMLKYGMPDVRSFFESDLRWLRHYGFAPLNIAALHEGLSQ